MHSPALADLLGRLPGSAPEKRSRSQPPTSCRGLGAACHPWGQGGTPRVEVTGYNSAATDEAAHRVSVAIQLTAASRSPPHQPIGAAGSPRHPLNGDSGLPANPPIAQFRASTKAPLLRVTVSAHERTTRQPCEEFTGARLPRRTHPEVSGVVPRAACRRSVGSGFTARVAWPPTFATMMHRPCDASRCFQTDRLGQRVP